MSEVTELPMFPLGSVLFPAMPMPLRVFEDRYVQMLQDVLLEDPVEFGVVLIERGQEVGGGEHRFSVGTIARIAELAPGDGFMGMLAQGLRRIEVVEWLDDAPYPRAMVRELPELEWDDIWLEQRDDAITLVRRTLARASEFEDQQWASTVQFADDPVPCLWQLAAVAPVGELDRMRFLRADSVPALLEAIVTATTDAAEVLDAR